MKRVLFIITFLFFSAVLFAQPAFDLGLKAGVNNSKIDFNVNDYSSESITKAHFGAFARIGWGRIFVQPEAYFSAKGGDLSSSIVQNVLSFDYSTFDVPMLLGFKIIKGGGIGLHAVAGPVFSFITSSSVSGSTDYNKGYFEDNYMGVQYGLGVDVWFLTFDARMEHGSRSMYSHPDYEGSNKTFMLSVGLKIL